VGVERVQKHTRYVLLTGFNGEARFAYILDNLAPVEDDIQNKRRVSCSNRKGIVKLLSETTVRRAYEKRASVAKLTSASEKAAFRISSPIRILF
jgi:hypothetical protein